MTLRPPAWLAAPLLSAFAVLRVAAASPGEHTVVDLATTLGGTIAATAVFWAAGDHIVARRGATDRTRRAIGLIGAVATALFFWGVPLVLGLNTAVGLTLSARYTVLVTLLALVAAVWLAWRSRMEFRTLSRLATGASVLLIAGACVQLVTQEIQLRRRLARDPVLAAARTLVSVRPRLGADPSIRRDIYLIILDSRANAATLDAYFGYDDRRFTDSLEKLGFVIPAHFHSNYVHTALSLPSLLNFMHVDRIAAEDAKVGRSSVARALVEENRSAAFLRGQGYRYFLFPSEWYGLTARSPLADETFRGGTAWGPPQLLRTELRRVLFNGTPVMRIPWFGDPTRYPRAGFAGLTHVPDDRRPTFVMAHFLLPHPPYVFEDDCQGGRHDPGRNVDLEKELYIRQVRCTDALVLDAVTRILARSTLRPIILIVGDHGSRTTPFPAGAPITDPSPALRERFGAFGAFLTPGVPQDLFADDLTLVNVMQRVLATYFGADVMPSADRFFAAGSRAFEFREVSADIATGAPGAATEAELPPR